MPKEFYKKEADQLSKRLDIVEAKLKNIAIRISTTNATSNAYWSLLKREGEQAYQLARLVFIDWAKVNIPKIYKDTLATQIRKIKNAKFQPPVKINYNSFTRKDMSVQSISIILKDAISSFVTGTLIGEKKLNRLMGVTQRINIQEKAANKAIKSGLIK